MGHRLCSAGVDHEARRPAVAPRLQCCNIAKWLKESKNSGRFFIDEFSRIESSLAKPEAFKPFSNPESGGCRIRELP